MDRNFQRSLSLVLKHEGGWADHPRDPGGATMNGVTLVNFRRYVKRGATKADLRKITDEQVATVYRRFYWDEVHGAELPDGVDYATFDFAVNSGPARAAKFLQKVVGAKVDGRIGPATKASVLSMPRANVVEHLCNDRLAFLKRLPTWSTFGKGWSNRVLDVRKEALAMTKQPAAVETTRSVAAIPEAKLAPAPSDPKSPRGRLTKLTLVMILAVIGVIAAVMFL